MITLLRAPQRTTRLQAQGIKQKNPLKSDLEQELERVSRNEAHLLKLMRKIREHATLAQESTAADNTPMACTNASMVTESRKRAIEEKEQCVLARNEVEHAMEELAQKVNTSQLVAVCTCSAILR